MMAALDPWMWLLVLLLAGNGPEGNVVAFSRLSSRPSRIIRTNYGSLRGMTVHPKHRGLAPVEVFLGVPYAAPPVGSLRFMPPMSSLRWSGVRTADRLPPVCPQKLPDVGHMREALKRFPEGRYQYLQRLLPMLSNQSEDCLFLNIYNPVPVP
ncbi:unnamed protein product, partial [Meganyctiphanes norvegica]